MKAQREHYLFYLQIGATLPEFYFQLGQILKAWGVHLIPLKLKDFKGLDQSERSDIVCFVPDMGSYREILKFKNEYLNYYLNLKQVRLYEVSSFSPSDSYQRHFRTGHYVHFSMPIAIESIAQKVVEDLRQVVEQNKEWPGGRRSTIPAV